jgi:PAS domain-containing protein
MSRSNLPLWPKPPVIWSYGIAILSVTAALILTQWPALRLQAAPVSLFLLAVMFSAWFGGVEPGVLAAALSALAFYYYLLPPMHSLATKPEETPRLIVFAVSLLLVGLLTAAQRSTTASLWRARDDLLGTVQQLQRSNEALQAESSERKRAEEKLEQSEAYLSEAQRLSRTGSFGWRPSTGEIFLSEETFRIFQYDPATKPTVELALQRVHAEDAALMRETIKRASKEGKDFEHEYRLLMPDGAVKHVHVVAHAERDESGELEFVGAVMDVSDRKRAEEELRRTEALAEQRLRLVVDTTPAMINTLRPDGYLDYVNKGWLDYFGFSLDTALDRADVMKMSPPSEADMYEGRWQPIIHPEDLPGFTDQWKSMLVSGKPGEREARVRRFD